MTTTVEAPIDFQVQALNIALENTELRENMAINQCIKAMCRNNNLTAALVRMQHKYHLAAGYPMPIKEIK